MKIDYLDLSCDSVIDMQAMGVGTEEILQYAQAVLSRSEVVALVRGLEHLLRERSTEPLALLDEPSQRRA